MSSCCGCGSNAYGNPYCAACDHVQKSNQELAEQHPWEYDDTGESGLTGLGKAFVVILVFCSWLWLMMAGG
jgi:hypothetical protein